MLEVGGYEVETIIFNIALIFVLILIACGIFAGFVLLLMGIGQSNQTRAKKRAKEILAAGRVEDPRKFETVLDVLAKTPNDLEAADLWKRLQALARQ